LRLKTLFAALRREEGVHGLSRRVELALPEFGLVGLLARPRPELCRSAVTPGGTRLAASIRHRPPSCLRCIGTRARGRYPTAKSPVRTTVIVAVHPGSRGQRCTRAAPASSNAFHASAPYLATTAL